MIEYQHSAPTESLAGYAGLHYHDKYQSILLNMDKNKKFLEIPFFCHLACTCKD